MYPNLVGQTLGKYRILEEIGWGGMAVVYKALDTVLGRDVALKVLDSRLARDAEFVQRFLHEARAAARLEHPNIVIIHDVGQDAGRYFIAMKYVDGRSLAEIIHREGPLPPARVARLVSQVADALDYAHAQGVIHRDVKPGNILVSRQDQIILTDFGLAKALAGSRLTQSGVLMGTPAYMSPEQVAGRPVGPATDVYALGVVAYEMLGGRPPFEGDTPHAVMYAQVNEPPPPLRQVNSRLPEAIATVVHKALAKDPRQRHRTDGAFAAALEEAVRSGETEVVRRPPPRKPPPSPVARVGQAPLWPLFGVLGAVLLVVVLAFGIGRSGGGPAGSVQMTPTPAVTVAVGTGDATETPARVTPTVVPTQTPTIAAPATFTETPSPTFTATPPPTMTPTYTLMPTPTATRTLRPTPSVTPSATPTAAPTRCWEECDTCTRTVPDPVTGQTRTESYPCNCQTRCATTTCREVCDTCTRKVIDPVTGEARTESYACNCRTMCG